MESTQGSYILQLCMGPSYFWGGLTHPDPPLFRSLSMTPIYRALSDHTNTPLIFYVANGRVFNFVILIGFYYKFL